MTANKRSKRNSIPYVTMYRIDGDLNRLRHHPDDGPAMSRLLQQCSPDVIRELVRGYRIAKHAGLLGDGHPPAKDLEGVISVERAEGLYEAIRLQLRKKLVDNV